MADSFLDSPRRGNRDWPDMRLADNVAPLNRIYQDTVTVSADLVRKFVKKETAEREVRACAVAGAWVNRLALQSGYEVVVDARGDVEESGARKLVVHVSGLSAAQVAAKVAEAVNGWLPMFTAAAVGSDLGIYNLQGGSAVENDLLGWARKSTLVTLMRPGLPRECLVGTYHPQCHYLMLVSARMTSATDTHATFSRTWQVDLQRLGEEESVDVAAMLKMGATTTQMMEKSLPPPRQFLPWVRTITETKKAPTTAQAEPNNDLLNASVNAETLAASVKTETRQEWGAPIALVSSEMDSETGVVHESRQEVVQHDDRAESINAAGQITSVQQVDDRWAIKSTRQASGLAGRAVNGVARQSYSYQDNYSWPAVLSHIDLQTTLSDPGDPYSAPGGYSWRPIWLTEEYNGPCTYTLEERWTLKKPILGGNPNWDATMVDESPHLPEPTQMMPQAIQFRGSALNIYIQPCLHSGQRIWDGQFYQYYPPTNPIRWPASVVSRVTLTPDQGGWLTRLYHVDSPPGAGRGSGLTLKVMEDNAGGFLLQWNSVVSGANTLLDVATDPSFQSGFLQGYRGKEIPNVGDVLPSDSPQTWVTGAARGLTYYARIRRGNQVSNTCVCSTKPVPEVQVLLGDEVVQSGDELYVGRVGIGDSLAIPLTVRNVGLLMLRDLRVTMNGEAVEAFSFDSLPNTLAPNSAVVPLGLLFRPSSAGQKTVELEIESNDESSPYTLTLTALGDAGVLQLEQPEGTTLVAQDEVDFGTVVGGSVSRTFKLRNVGNAPLRNIQLDLSEDAMGDFTVSEPLEVTEVAGNTHGFFTVTFEPLAGDAGPVRRGVMRVHSSDHGSPFEIHLKGEFRPPFAPGTLDADFNVEVDGPIYAAVTQADGKIIIGGDFYHVNSTERAYCARLNSDGTLDDWFYPGPGGPVYALAIQKDGKIVIGGAFEIIFSTPCQNVARVHEDGSVDEAFSLPVLSGTVRALAVQEDGKILMGGNITLGTNQNLVRIHTDGTHDTGFNTEINGPVNGILVEKRVNELGVEVDDKIMVVGDWSGNAPTTTTSEDVTTTTEEITTTTIWEETTTTSEEVTTTTTSEEDTTTTTSEEDTTTTSPEEDTTTTPEET